MSDLVKKINLEQKFANLVYKDFQAKRFGLTPCCTPDVNEIKFTKWLCDYQDLKEHDDALEGTPDLDITYVDCNAVVPIPEPTPPDNTPFPEPVETCRSIYINGIDQRIFVRASSANYTNFGYNKNHTHSVWVKLPAIAFTGRSQSIDYLFYTRYKLDGVLDASYGMGFEYHVDITPSGTYTGYLMYVLRNTNVGLPLNALYKMVFAALPTGQWLNITVTSDGLTAAGTRFFVNGLEFTTVLSFAETLSSSITYDVADSYEIGAITNITGETGPIYSEFVIHSLRSWDTILTPAEILTEYNSGFKTVPPVLDPNCVTNVECNTSVWDAVATEYEMTEDKNPATWSTDNALITDLVNDCPDGV